MNIKTISQLILMLFIFSVFTFAQSKPEEPEVPEEPSFEFDFHDFHNISEEDEKELLKNIKNDLRKELQVIKNINEDKYFEFLRESQYKNMKIPFMAKREKLMHERERKIFESEIRTEALAAKYTRANESEKRNIKNQIRTELNGLFEQKEQRRKQEVEVLSNELKELKKSLEVRQKNKKDIIERRVQELLDEDQYLDWD